MLRILYHGLTYGLLPFALMRLFIKSIRQPLYRKRWWERLGFIRCRAYPNTIWLHAVSLGEVNAAVTLVRYFLKKHPDIHWVISTTTGTGYARASSQLGETVQHFNAPFDAPGAVKRFLHRAQPKMLVIMETELWPNLIHYTARQGVPIYLANARLSERSANGYHRFAQSTKAMLQQITMIAAQYQQDALRFIALGASPEQVMVGGNLKFNQGIPDDIEKVAERLQSKLGASRPVWVAASTQKGEEALVIKAFQKCRGYAPHLLLIVAPRHPERSRKVQAMLKRADIPYALHSELKESLTPSTQCLIIDGIGHLLACYHVADMAFIGGSLVPKGGQNCLEAAALHTAIITGPHMTNFAHIHQMLVNANACTVAEDAMQLAERVIHLLQDPEACHAMTKMARAIYDDNQDALEKQAAWIETTMGVASERTK